MSVDKFNLGDYSGGLNTLDGQPVYTTGAGVPLGAPPGGPTELTSVEWADNSVNVQMIGSGKSIRSRKPFQYVLSQFFVDEPIRSLMRYKTSGSDELIGYDSIGRVFYISYALGTYSKTSLLTPLSGAFMGFEQSTDSTGVDYVWFQNGGGMTPRKMKISDHSVSNWGGTPPHGQVLKSWKNRMVIVETGFPARIRFSKINDPENWPSTNFIDIKSVDDELDEIVALENIGEDLLVFKRNSVWRIYDSTNFQNERIGAVGADNMYAVAKVVDRVYWFSSIGRLYSTDGTDVTHESERIAPITVDAFTRLFFTQVPRLLATEDSRLILTVDRKMFEIHPLLTWQDDQGRSSPPWTAHTSNSKDFGDNPEPARFGAMAEWLPNGGIDNSGHYTPEIMISMQQATANSYGFSVVFSDYTRQDHFSDSSNALVPSLWASPWIAGGDEVVLKRALKLFITFWGNVKASIAADFNTAVEYESDDILVESANRTAQVKIARPVPAVRGRHFQVRLEPGAGNEEGTWEVHDIELGVRGANNK
jgi:hypothetical protein